MSTPDVPWRVYLPEWLFAYTSDALGPEGQVECLQHFRFKYDGRVREQDWRVVPAVSEVELARAPYALQLYLPNLRGEFRDEGDAMSLLKELVRQLHPVPSVVRRDSPQEQALLGYGRKKLPAGAGKGT